jgi:hypothetical protein
MDIDSSEQLVSPKLIAGNAKDENTSESLAVTRDNFRAIARRIESMVH